MATKKDLVEAYSFSRRRLVTAFVSGAPGGREVEPARPGRTIVGGLALAVLLGAGAAIAGVFAPTAPSDWKKPGQIISKSTGSSYVILEESSNPELRPVINSTSARLILGDQAKPTLIAQDIIEDQRIGDDIGILGAPDSVPTASLLIQSGWTACTAADAGIKVAIAEKPDVTPVSRYGITVSNGGDYFVVVPAGTSSDPGADDPGAYVYPVPPQGKDGNQTDNLLGALNLQPTTDAVPVSREWINLFPTGAPLTWSSFEITDAGTPPKYAADDDTGVLDDKLIGDLLVTKSDQKEFLLTNEGPLELSDFEAQVYRNVIGPSGALPEAKEVETLPQVRRAPEREKVETYWPETPPQDSIEEPCAQLTARAGEAPVVQLAAPGTDSSGSEVPVGTKEPVVAKGRGAFVLSGGWSDTDQGSPFVIDSTGAANPLVGDDAVGLLGYGSYDVAVVPDTWVKLFACGVNLSRDAALSPPAPPDEARCQ